MYPIFNVSQLQHNKAPRICRDVTDTDRLLVPGKVTTATFVTPGASTTAIDPEQLRGAVPFLQLVVENKNNETIELEESCRPAAMENVHWIRSVRLAEDCHSYNAQLRLVPSQRRSPKLVLQCVRPIAAGQELLMWFSEDVLAKLQMVFLVPVNIQGQKKYVCNKCLASYESPNPLKLHLTLNCGRYSLDALWQKLANALRDDTASVERTAFKFDLAASPSRHVDRIIDLSRTNRTVEGEGPRRSAFKPVFAKNNNNNERFQDAGEPFALTGDYRLTTTTTTTSTARDVDEEAHIETLVSSLGKSTNGGHVCLYCGKCYSRKYGLKIHIRTHTGYKPLKCKYCSRPFGDPSNLNKHTRLHAEGSTPYKCGLCGKVLVRRRDLERHLKSRHTPFADSAGGVSPKTENTTEEEEEEDEDEDIILVD